MLTPSNFHAISNANSKTIKCLVIYQAFGYYLFRIFYFTKSWKISAFLILLLRHFGFEPTMIFLFIHIIFYSFRDETGAGRSYG